MQAGSPHNQGEAMGFVYLGAKFPHAGKKIGLS